MDKIIINDLEIIAKHGVLPEEKVLPQKFLVSMYAQIDLRQAGILDSLERTESYSDIVASIKQIFETEIFCLLEKLAEECARRILIKFPKISSLELKIKKPWAPIGTPINYAGISIFRAWHKAYLGLGSNIGEREKFLLAAIEEINSEDTRVTKISSFYETKPVGYIEQPDFINCVIELKTLYSPRELMALALDTEKKLGRIREIKWGPRTIDIDLLLYDNLVTDDDFVTLPHPLMTERLFVLEPLCELNKNIIHPIENKRMGSIKEALERSLIK